MPPQSGDFDRAMEHLVIGLRALGRTVKDRANLDWTCGLRDAPWLSQSIAIRPSLRAAHRRSSVLRCQGRSNEV